MRLTIGFSGGAYGAGTHVWTLTIPKVVTIYEVSRQASTGTEQKKKQTDKLCMVDPLLVHIRVRGSRVVHQDLDPLLLLQDIPKERRPLLPRLPRRGQLHGSCLPYRGLDHHGHGLSARLLLLGTVHGRRWGVPRADQQLLPRPRRDQHDQRHHRPAHPDPADLEAADERGEEAGGHRCPGPRKLVRTPTR